MLAKDIKVGGTYLAKVNGRVVPCRVNRIEEHDGTRSFRGHTTYHVTNTLTGRPTTFRSAAKFRCVATPIVVRAIKEDSVRMKQPLQSVGYHGEEPDPLRPTAAEQAKQSGRPGDCATCDGYGTLRNPSRRCPDCGGSGKVNGRAPDTEDEQGSDPTPAPRAVATSRTAAAATKTSSASPSTAPRTSPPLKDVLKKVKDVPNTVGNVVGRYDAGTKIGNMTPTEEQWAGLEEACRLYHLSSGQRVLVWAAGAGTGKTSSLKMLEQVLNGRGQYTAFNSDLVAESKSKFVKASCRTTHSLAFGAVGRLFAHRLPKGDGQRRARWYEVARTLGLEDYEIDTGVKNPVDGKPVVKRLTAAFLAGQVLEAVRRFCQSAERELTTDHFKYIDGIDQVKVTQEEDGTSHAKRGYEQNNKLRKYLLPFAKTAWADLSSVHGVLPFNHDVYVKLWQLGHNGARPHIAADYILLDEAQDTAPVFLDIIKQQTHALLVMVGDDNQQIYEWRGACNAMAAFPGAPRRMLSQSFRFGQKIADVANAILAQLEQPTDLVLRGLPSLPSAVYHSQMLKRGELAFQVTPESRCTLCRTNAGAVGVILQARKQGKRGYLSGKVDDIVRFVRGAQDLKAGRSTTHHDLACFSNWKEVVEYVESDEGGDLKLMVKLIKEFTCEGILDALENMPEEKDADLVASTAHKSKGREWDSVKLGADFPTCDRMSDADVRLLYVAATRAKLALDVTACPPFIPGQKDRDGRDIPYIRIPS